MIPIVLRDHGWRAASTLTTFRVSNRSQLLELLLQRCDTLPCECGTKSEDQLGLVAHHTEGGY